jgi:ABC-2 type transport system permease protein
MKKLFLIGWKDLTLIARDPAALVLMLLAPFALTLGLGFVTGRFSGGSSFGLSDIPVLLVNEDSGELGAALIDLFQSEALSELVTAQIVDDADQARQRVDDDQAATAILIPQAFSQSIIPEAAGGAADSPASAVQIGLYTNPTRPASVGVVKTIVDEFVSAVEVGRVGGTVAVTQLLVNGLIQPQEAAELGAEIGGRQATAGQSHSITVRNVTSSGQEVTFDVLAYMAPGMALMFLMFTVSYGGRSLLAERDEGTLPRLLVSPTTATQVLGGKVVGILMTGAAQMMILIGASTLLFRLNWGDALGVLVLVLAAVAGATGWGMLITAMARTPGQVSVIGSALMLTFGILGGSFVSLQSMPRWYLAISKITPNAWGLDGFNTLARGGRLVDILGPVGALLGMGLLLFAIAAFVFGRRGLAEG